MRRLLFIAGAMLCLSVFAGAADNAGLSEQWVSYGNKLAAAGYFDRAIVAYEKAIYIDAGNAAAFEASGRANIKLNNYEAAFDYIKTAYGINGKPGLKELEDSLGEQTMGFRNLNFYPLTFDILMHGGLNLYPGSGSEMSVTASYGGGAYIFYHLNDYFVLETGVMIKFAENLDYSEEFANIPFALGFKFGYSTPLKPILSAGFYFAPKLTRQAYFMGYEMSKMPGYDAGLHFEYRMHVLFGKWGLTFGPEVQYSLMDIYPGIKQRPLSLGFDFGVTF